MNARVKASQSQHTMSAAGAAALLDAATAELEERKEIVSVEIAAELVPYWLEWDRRGGFAEGADCAALFAAWERSN